MQSELDTKGKGGQGDGEKEKLKIQFGVANLSNLLNEQCEINHIIMTNRY